MAFSDGVFLGSVENMGSWFGYSGLRPLVLGKLDDLSHDIAW